MSAIDSPSSEFPGKISEIMEQIQDGAVVVKV